MSKPIFNNYKLKIILYNNNLKMHKNSRKFLMMVNKLKDRNPIHHQKIIRLTF